MGETTGKRLLQQEMSAEKKHQVANRRTGVHLSKKVKKGKKRFMDVALRCLMRTSSAPAQSITEAEE